MLSACTVVAALVAYSLFVMQSAKASAEQIAAGRPYCMQVAKNEGGYRSVGRRLDLAGFYMMSQSARHSVLIVSDADKLEFYHWSYRHNGFVTDPYASPPIWCELAADFLKQPRAYRQAQVNRRWNVAASYSLYGESIAGVPAGFGELTAVEHQFQVHSGATLLPWLKWNVDVYYVGSLTTGLVSDYYKLDSQLEWAPTSGLHLRLGIKDALSPRRRETGINSIDPPTLIERRGYLQASWWF